MNRRDRLHTFLLTAVLSTACGPPQIAKPQGGVGSGASAPGASDASPPAPAFSLPDAGPDSRTGRDGAAPPAAPNGQCAGVAQEAESGPVDLLLLMDSSGSMGSFTRAGRSRWETAQIAFDAFIRDPNSRGLGVGLQFFPLYVTKPCATDQDCVGVADFCQGRSACPGSGPLKPGPSCKAIGDPLPTRCQGGAACLPTGSCAGSGAVCTNVGQPCPGGAGMCEAFPRTCFGNNDEPDNCKLETYSNPVVAIGRLPEARATLLTAMNGQFPFGVTPMGSAAEGALAYLKAHRMANPGRRASLVLVTDGLPSGGCRDKNTIPGTAAVLAAALQGSPSIRTYVIGMFTEMELAMAAMQVDQLAAAGGTDKAIVLPASSDFNSQLQQALNQVRGSLGCEYQIPAPPNGGLIDFGKVNVHYSNATVSEDIPYVESSDRCDPTRGGWYYDVLPASGVPTRIITCATTCGRLRATEMGRVDVVFGCGTRGID